MRSRKHIRKLTQTLFAVMAAVSASGAAPGSFNYEVIADTVDAGGGLAGSASYRMIGSFGSFGGMSTSSSTTHVAKHGYAGQLYRVLGLTIGCSNTNVDEATSRQIIAQARLDDGTTMSLKGAHVLWRGLDGPVSVASDGFVTADFVYRNTIAAVCGACDGQTNLLTLRIRNVGNDDCGIYAGDGLRDDWQVSYFGENNPAAAPAADPDGDSQNNEFEFGAGTNPLDAASRFSLSIASVPGQPAQKRILFSPIFPDRTYSVEYSLTDGLFTGLTDALTIDDGRERTVVDPHATDPMRLYRVVVHPP
jgi:hypothetical protein